MPANSDTFAGGSRLRIAAERLSESGFLHRRIVTAHDATGVLAEMLAIRDAGPTPRRQAAPDPLHIAEAAPKPLAAAARRAKWLKVDQVATYR